MLDKHYQSHQLEKKWYQRWTEKNIFEKVSQRDSSDSYCIMIPPPNVTGTLHMGHALQDSLMDSLIRYQAQQGKKVLWQVGTDHAGIATQMVVERLLEREGLDRSKMSRKDFLDRVWEWKDHSGGQILSQLKRLGTFIDWNKERFTMDPAYNESVLHAFVRLYRDGLIYRKKRLVNWDCHLQSAVSDLEVEFHEEQGQLYEIKYQLETGSEFLVVATTRPETIFGDVAVAVHPSDSRYAHLVGQKVKLPLTNRLIPIIADDYVDPEFGTGCLKITPGHDFNDFAVGERHGLSLINILNLNGTLNDEVPEKFRGIDRIQARSKIVDLLKEDHLLMGIQKHTHEIPKCSRTDQVIEPLATEQWFVSMEAMAQKALKAGEEGQLEFFPKLWEKQYKQWLENIQDWCISRQLWWGHQIPAWYDDQGNHYVGLSESEVREHYQLNPSILLKQDDDVLDTWFSSALWPFATLGWPHESTLKPFFPTQVLVTGFDIIFFWVARMVMFSLYFTGEVPFKDIYIHGLIQDHQGQKMSKSKGNVIDPIDLIDGISLSDLLEKRTQGLMQPEKAAAIREVTSKDYPQGLPSFGADALRLTYCLQASPARFIRFDIQRLQTSQNFCNKLWNMLRFVMMQLEDYQSKPIEVHHSINKAILVKIKEARIATAKYFEEYRFDLLSNSLVDLAWKDICDDYIELSKVLLKNPKYREETQAVLIQVIAATLHLLHPMMPFITDELFETLSQKSGLLLGKTLVEIHYSDLDRLEVKEESQEEVIHLLEMITTIRTARSKMDVPPKVKSKLYVEDGSSVQRLYGKYQEFFDEMTKIEEVCLLTTLPSDGTSLSFKDEVFGISFELVIDIESKRVRLELDKTKCKKEIEKSQQKLASPSFVEKAPPAVVAQEEQRLNDYLVQLKAIEDSLSLLN